ncbi:uncharacterized protein [Dysidea avara]|uniref:uncharacterized protein isoform X2 n=1 Tax=Dysidea avara TaxID=196820 RepID=UPI0033292D2F
MENIVAVVQKSLHVDRLVVAKDSTVTENILCVDKDRTYPLRYNVQGCVGGRYTLELPMQNNSGICLSDMGLFMTVADLQPGKEQFNCYQDSRFTSMTIIVFDGRNPYRDVIIEVNGEERENASDLVEGDKVKIVAQAVGSVGNIVDSAICSSGTHVTCSSSFLCNGSQSANRYFQYLFFPLTLAHDGIVVPFRTNDGNTLGNVTLHVRGTITPSATIIESLSSMPPPESAIVTLSMSSPPSSPTPSSSMTLPDATPIASPAGDSVSDGEIVLIVLVVVIPVILFIVLIIIFYFYWLRKQHNNCVRRKSEEDGNPSMPTMELLKMMVHTCATDSCPIKSLKGNLLSEFGDIVTEEDLPNNPSTDAIIERLDNGAIWTTCGCEANRLQKVLSRSSYKKWKKIVYLTNTRNNNDQTHEMVLRILCDNLSDDVVLRTVRDHLLDIQEKKSSRSSSVNSSKRQIDGLLEDQEQIKAKIVANQTQVLECHTQILENLNNLEVKQTQIVESQRRTEENQVQILEKQDLQITQGHAELNNLQCLESKLQDLQQQSHQSA